MSADDNTHPTKASAPRSPRFLVECNSLVQRLYGESGAARWDLSMDRFAAALESSVFKRFAGTPADPALLEQYLGALHLEDLALACACAEGLEAAWEHFVANYRGYLRASASAILRCGSDSAQARELADSLFAELYGLGDGERGRRSLFRYFHGRSALKTWLRAVLAQRHVDVLRAQKRFAPLEDDEGEAVTTRAVASSPVLPGDPHRLRYVALFSSALQAAFARLDPYDHERLRMYYAEELTLAEIGRILGEHESSASRNLDRVRRELRTDVEQTLRNGTAATDGSAAVRGLSDAEISLCFEYAAEDAPFDLNASLARKEVQSPSAGRPKS